MKGTVIDVFIEGTPYCQSKARGNKDATRTWSDTVIKETRRLPKIKGRCRADIAFILPDDKFPKDHPHGPDLDNLLKRLFDALNRTVFSEVQGTDGCVVQLKATKKKKAFRSGLTGVRIRLTDLGL